MEGHEKNHGGEWKDTKKIMREKKNDFGKGRTRKKILPLVKNLEFEKGWTSEKNFEFRKG